MAFDQTQLSTPKTFPAFLSASSPLNVDDAVTEFEDRLWVAAEAAIAAGAPSMAIVATTASLVRRQSEMFASILSGAEHLRSLGEDAGPVCGEALSDDIAATQDRLISQLQRDLSGL